MKHSAHIGQREFMLANRRAARREDIEEHGRPTAFRSHKHASLKAYNRSRDGKRVRPDDY